MDYLAIVSLCMGITRYRMVRDTYFPYGQFKLQVKVQLEPLSHERYLLLPNPHRGWQVSYIKLS